jgi:cell wall assembly regulator SMI1
MTRKSKVLMIVAGCAVGVVAALILAAPALQRSFFYPKPRNLPSVVSQSVEQLLTHLQAALETNAPAVVQALQPGLSEGRISALEAQGGFRLSGDLRAFYRWHNGTATNSTLGLLPGQRFLPLEQCVAERANMGQQTGSVPAAQRASFAVFAGHRKSWVHVLDDGAGDGYFYDPERMDANGAFFYHMAEGGYYVWFPSFRNFLSGVTECYETRCVRLSADGRSLDQDGPGAEKIWQRLAKASESGG